MELSGLQATFIALTCILLYTAYYLVAFVRPVQRMIPGLRNMDPSSLRPVGFQRVAGFIMMGVMSYLILTMAFNYDAAKFGLNSGEGIQTLTWWLAMAVIILPLSYFNARKADNLSVYPQMRFRGWTGRHLLISNFTWLLYLLGYEFMFRGVLFFGLYYAFGLWPAMILNTVLYALAHLPKNMKETLGSIPMGFVLCYSAYSTGSFWAAFLIHGTMALSNEYFSILHHPEMRFSLRRSL